MMTQKAITGQEGLTDNSPYSALVEFYQAFNNRNMTLMQKNWNSSSETAMNNPLGGIKRGWDEIQSVYENIFNGKAEVYVEFYDYTIHEFGDIFYAVGRERGAFKVDESTIDLAIRTSRIYKKENGIWEQVHHHGSIENPTLLKTYQELAKNNQSLK
jgi:ketosteroid isomerase-like protein